MNQAEFDAAKATFPWTERTSIINGVGGFIQVIDRNGHEVPLMVMTAFLQLITRKLMPVAAQPSAEPVASPA